MLRVVRRGDRHDPKDLTVSCRFEGDFGASFTAGRSEGLVPGEALKNLVHATARTDGHGEIESFGLALCERLLSSFPRITKVRVEIAEQMLVAARDRRQGAGPGVRGGRRANAARPPSPATAGR